MKVLIIKTSSLGDIIHTLPALTDAGKIFPAIRFDWVVEEAFAEVPSWHPLVDKIIPVALRRWRKQPLKTLLSAEWKSFRKQLRAEKYDYVIDAQGLIKSAFLTYFARGIRCGLDRHSAWEPLATLAYQRTYSVLPEQHAVTRVRQLFAGSLHYAGPTNIAEYGIDLDRLLQQTNEKNTVVFLHGTTWSTKHWPEQYWQTLAQHITQTGLRILLPWGNPTEYQRAQKIAANSPMIEILPKLNLREIAGVLVNAKAAIAVDTGLGHLAAALNVPTLSLYGPTNPKLTGTVGAHQIHLSAHFPCAPCLQANCTYTGPREVEPACFSTVTPEMVWQKLREIL